MAVNPPCSMRLVVFHSMCVFKYCVLYLVVVSRSLRSVADKRVDLRACAACCVPQRVPSTQRSEAQVLCAGLCPNHSNSLCPNHSNSSTGRQHQQQQQKLRVCGPESWPWRLRTNPTLAVCRMCSFKLHTAALLLFYSSTSAVPCPEM